MINSWYTSIPPEFIRDPTPIRDSTPQPCESPCKRHGPAPEHNGGLAFLVGEVFGYPMA